MTETNFVFYFQPFPLCVSCMGNIYNMDQNNLAVPQLVIESPTTYPPPDSSDDLIDPAQSISESESLTESLQPSQQLSDSLGPSGTIPLVPVNSSLSSNNSSAAGDVFRPPMDPQLVPQYLQIMSRPGPKSLKRKRIKELLNNNSLEEMTKNTPPEPTTPTPVYTRVQQTIQQRIQERLKSKKPKRPNQNSSESSLSSNGSSASLITSFPERNQQNSIPVLSQLSSQDPGLFMSPRSSQLMQQSPAVEPAAVNRRRRLPSSSLSSDEETTPLNQRRTERGAISGGHRPPSPDRSPPLPAAAQRVSPPLPTTVRRRINDGIAHTNKGAPRRVAIPQPGNQTPATGVSGRDPRVTNNKVINGG